MKSGNVVPLLNLSLVFRAADKPEQVVVDLVNMKVPQ